jgi:ferredoxin
MKISADRDSCQGHARCQDCCPGVFGTDDFLGKVVILLDEVPESLQQSAALAVRNCPEGALTIVSE